ncbi:MAG: glycoside hydrolase family 9 protein [Verrucomicrobiota bacterium]
MKTKMFQSIISNSVMSILVGCGLLWSGPVRAAIALQDGSIFSTNQTGSGVSTIANHFTVTAGASVMVAALWDLNSHTNSSSPSFLVWSNTTLGSTQILTRAVTTNEQDNVYADSDLYYLWNPSVGTGVISGTDTNTTAPTFMFLQTYTLSGVDTTITPFGVGNGNSSASSLSVTTPITTAAGSWAAVASVNYNGGTGNFITNTASSGGAVDFNFQPAPGGGVLQLNMGYITNLASGASTITATATGSATHMDVVAEVFAPLLGSGTNAVTPAFSNLSNQTINYGSTSVTLTGIVGTSSNSLPNGTAVSASVNGIAHSGGVYDLSGDFSISYNAVGIPASGTPYTVTYTSGVALGFNAATNTSTTMTINPLPVVLSGSVTYSSTSTTTVPASSLGVVNLVGSDSLTLSGSVTIASTNVGVEAIISFSGLTLGGPAATNYTLAGASGTVTVLSSAPQTSIGITEIRTASPTELVAFYTYTNVTGPVWQTVYPTNLVTTSQPSKWTLNGTPVQAINGAFVTEANSVEYHIYLQVPQLINGTYYTLVTPYSTNSFVFQDSQILCESIKVNQNGYSALATSRYANLAIWLGTGGPQQISGSMPTYTVVSAFTGQQVASGTLSNFTSGGADSSSGDYVYRIDLSSVPAGGPYRIVVSGYGCSYPFGVGGDFSRRLGYVAFRALYYQRCGCPIVQPYAYANIRPTPCHTAIYDNQSPDSPSTGSINTSTSGTKLFVHGGYHDAGDSQKNPYALLVPITLMTAYEVFPGAFTTNQFNIPATFDANYNITGGYNGIPDILNEVNWGLMLYTNLQSTPNEAVGAVAFGTASNNEPPWGINYDQDTLTYSTEVATGWSSGLAAGAFMHFARLIQPYNPTLSAVFHADAVAAYAAAGSGATYQHQLYYNIEKYLMDGDTTSSNNIKNLYTHVSGFTSSWHDEAGGFATDNGNIWTASYFMSYIVATNRPTDPTVVAYFKNILQTTADEQVAYVNGDAYPSGWPANVNPSSYNWNWGGAFTSQGEFAYPCLMEWAVSGQQQYINAVCALMDYDQGLNPIGKCYMTGIGFNRTWNPEERESSYAVQQGMGGPHPGITSYGPANNGNSWIAAQIPPALSLPRERMWVDDLGDTQWGEFTDYQNEAWPAAIYPVLAQSGVWSPTQEPFLYQGATIAPNGSGGYVLQFGGIPYQTYVLQAATSVNGPWSTVSGPVKAGVTGLLQFTHTPASTQMFYRTMGQTQKY